MLSNSITCGHVSSINLIPHNKLSNFLERLYSNVILLISTFRHFNAEFQRMDITACLVYIS